VRDRPGPALTSPAASIAVRRCHNEVVELCRTALDSVTLRREVMARIRRSIPYDAFCCGTIDPQSLLITSEVTENVPAAAIVGVVENEYLTEDVNKWSTLARSDPPVGILHLTTGGSPERSPRYGLLMGHGFEHELRVAFVADQECWGGVTMLRRRGAAAFTEAEAKQLTRLGPHLARAFRNCLRTPPVIEGPHAMSPGMVVLDARNAIELMTPSASEWLADLPGLPATGSAPMPLLGVAARVRALAGGDGRQEARMRVRTRSGRWLILHGAPVRDREGRDLVALLFENAPLQDVTGLIFDAHGLSERERDVVTLLLSGASTSEIAATLFITSYTVQDHLKSIFSKFGLRSRRELVARILASGVSTAASDG
jgi:DNA-binding CsgD family transcriptional regulator